MFHYFSLEEVYQYAEQKGFDREDVIIEKVCVDYDYELQQEMAWEYEVSLGDDDSEQWMWWFDDLEEVATDYVHGVWED